MVEHLQHYFQEPLVVQEPQLHHAREVIDEFSELRQFIQDQVIDKSIAPSPPELIIMTFAGEPSSSKGTLATQESYYLEEDPIVQATLTDAKVTIKQHYLSTSLLVQEGIRRGVQKSEYGAPTLHETQEMTKMTDKALAVFEGEIRSSTDRPPQRNDQVTVNLLWQELVAIDETFDLGTSMLKRQAISEDTGVVFVASIPEIQEREYRRRKRASEGIYNKKSYAVFDMDSEDARHTMGTHTSVELVTSLMNEAMHTAWKKEEFTLPTTGPNKVPAEVLKGEDPRELEGTALEEFFTGLTEFNGKGMHTNRVRPYLQVGYYEHLAEKWNISHALVLLPRFVPGSIHVYPRHILNQAVDLSGLVDKAVAQHTWPPDSLK